MGCYSLLQLFSAPWHEITFTKEQSLPWTYFSNVMNHFQVLFESRKKMAVLFSFNTHHHLWQSSLGILMLGFAIYFYGDCYIWPHIFPWTSKPSPVFSGKDCRLERESETTGHHTNSPIWCPDFKKRIHCHVRFSGIPSKMRKKKVCINLSYFAKIPNFIYRYHACR